MRAVIYARYSTDLQREASIEDQVRVWRQRLERECWTPIATYSDAASSGVSGSGRATRSCSRTPAPAPSTWSWPSTGSRATWRRLLPLFNTSPSCRVVVRLAKHKGGAFRNYFPS
jgi:hypothetical protein